MGRICRGVRRFWCSTNVLWHITRDIMDIYVPTPPDHARSHARSHVPRSCHAHSDTNTPSRSLARAPNSLSSSVLRCGGLQLPVNVACRHDAAVHIARAPRAL